MATLQDAAVRLYHKRVRDQNELLFKYLEAGERFENTNFLEIWWWANKRWPRTFSQREYELSDRYEMGR